MSMLIPLQRFTGVVILSLILCFSGFSQTNHCIKECNDNTFLNTSDPNTIEYDNIISTYHSTIIKEEEEGSYVVWGEFGAPSGVTHQLVATAITASNGYDYQGDILKVTAGSKGMSGTQFIVLTTEGLYAWGTEGIVIDNNLTIGSSFAKIADTETVNETQISNFSLPINVLPSDVKMMFGTANSIVIVTCIGQVWILTQDYKLYADGSTLNDQSSKYKWHRVQKSNGVVTDLNNVVAVRGKPGAM